MGEFLRAGLRNHRKNSGGPYILPFGTLTILLQVALSSGQLQFNALCANIKQGNAKAANLP